MISQKELAKRLNLSQPTISRAIRNAADINLETRARVLAELDKLGLPLPHNDKTISESELDKKDLFLGVFCGGSQAKQAFNDILYLDSLCEETANLGINLIVHKTGTYGRELLSESEWPAALRKGLLSGLILIYRFDPEVVCALAKRLPVVTITHWVRNAGCDHVDSDHITAMSELVSHLIGLGHRRFGFLMPSGDTSYEYSRYTSTIRALLDHGIDTPPRLWVGTGENTESFQTAVNIIINGLADGITAWLADTDLTVDYLLPLLEERGIKVPEQVSLTGFDAFKSILRTTRDITTAKTPTRQMGQEAIRLLLRRIENPRLTPIQVLIDTPLQIGDTTGLNANNEEVLTKTINPAHSFDTSKRKSRNRAK